MIDARNPNLDPDFPAEDAVDSALLQEVDVKTEAIAGRQRKVTAQIPIFHSVEQVWQVLTNYNTLAQFIPNLAKSQRIEHPAGGIRLEQVGSQRLLRFNFSARVVLDMEEKFPEEIKFEMVEGDFNAYSGSWRLESMLGSERPGTLLTYTVLVWPKRTMPIAIIERRLRLDLPKNLIAIRERVDQLFG